MNLIYFINVHFLYVYSHFNNHYDFLWRHLIFSPLSYVVKY